VTGVDINGVKTTTTYTGINASTGAAATSVASATGFSVQVSTTAPAGTGLLKQGATDLTNLNVTSGNVDQMTADVEAALKAVTGYASNLGSTQSRVNTQATFISSLSNALTTGVSSLVDADMNEASTRLQALQTQQQLGIQSLSIANQNTQLILKLFQG
jgi:flagellin-like hook-associated protein FlgL